MNSTFGQTSFSQKEAARMLVTDSALGQLTFNDALKVVNYMRPKRIKSGTVFIHEGEKVHTDYMLLVIAGDVRVESLAPGMKDQVVVSVITSGSLLGEMGLLDGAARSATCTAATDLAVAVLSRSALIRMIAEDPALAAQFMLAISSRFAERLRETTQKLKRFVQLNNVLQQEVFTLMDAQDSGHKRNIVSPKKLRSTTNNATASQLESMNYADTKRDSQLPAQLRKKNSLSRL